MAPFTTLTVDYLPVLSISVHERFGNGWLVSCELIFVKSVVVFFHKNFPTNGNKYKVSGLWFIHKRRYRYSNNTMYVF